MAANAGYRTPRYLTFEQVLELGGNVRKGEHGTKVYFVKQLQVADQDGEEGKTHIVPMMREYTVFNVDQCEGLPDRVLTLGEVKLCNPDERDATIDGFLACSGATIQEGFGEAYYRPGDDGISLPRFESFKSAAHFYGSAFHELGHWTGHKSRLDRDLRHRFGEGAHAAEELVAELFAAFLCAEFSIDGGLRHAAVSKPGLASCGPTAARFSRHAVKHKLLPTICAASRCETSNRLGRREWPPRFWTAHCS